MPTPQPHGRLARLLQILLEWWISQSKCMTSMDVTTRRTNGAGQVNRSMGKIVARFGSRVKANVEVGLIKCVLVLQKPTHTAVFRCTETWILYPFFCLS